MTRTLAALSAVSAEAGAPVDWYPSDQPTDSTWHGWLIDALADDPTRRVSGWRASLAADPELDSLFRACEGRIDDLLPAVPERRDLVHGDLLNAMC